MCNSFQPCTPSPRKLIELSYLSADVQTLIASFLRTKDVLQYNLTCKAINRSLSFRIICNVNTIQYQHCHNHNNNAIHPTLSSLSSSSSSSFSKSNHILRRKIVPQLPKIGKHAMHSYRIYIKEGICDNQTFTFSIKNCYDELMAFFIVDRDNKDIVFVPCDVSHDYFLCHSNQDDDDVEIKFCVDVLVHYYNSNSNSNSTSNSIRDDEDKRVKSKDCHVKSLMSRKRKLSEGCSITM